MAWDRFAYTLNNPVKYTDPTGHDTCDETGNCYTRHGTLYHRNSGTYYGLPSKDDYQILVAFMAMESSSTLIPASVYTGKAWALLNLMSYRMQYFSTTPFDAWKNHQRGTMTSQGIGGKNERGDVLKWGKEAALGLHSFTMNEYTHISNYVASAARLWSMYGSGSKQDPTHGAVGFADATGCYYPNGDKPPTLQETFTHNGVIDWYGLNSVLSNKKEMTRFHALFVNSSELYIMGKNSNPWTGQPIWMFTVYHPDSQGEYYINPK